MNIHNKLFFSLLLVALCLSLNAQVRIPALSPGASISRVVGITKISIDYSSPGVRDRKIWGGLLPYDVPWRAGANAPTTLTLQDEVTINDKVLSKGSYSIFITPSEKGKWKVHINKGNENGKSIFGFIKDGVPDIEAIEAADALTLELNAQTQSDNQEHLAYDIRLRDKESAEITIIWEKIKLSFVVKTQPIKLAEESIKSHLDWYTLASSASFYLENGKNLEQAETLARYSVTSQEHFYNKWVLAKVLKSRDKKKEAIEFAAAAQEFGTKNPSNFYNNYKDEIDKKLKEWKSNKKK